MESKRKALNKAAAANSKDDFRYVFGKAFEGLMIDRMEGKEAPTDACATPFERRAQR